MLADAMRNASVTATRMVNSPQAMSMWAKAKAWPGEHPFAFGVLVSGAKTSFSDLLVQKVVGEFICKQIALGHEHESASVFSVACC